MAKEVKVKKSKYQKKMRRRARLARQIKDGFYDHENQDRVKRTPKPMPILKALKRKQGINKEVS